MEFMQRVSLVARSASLRLLPPHMAADPCIAGLTPGRTPVTCATDVARSDKSWGLTPKTGPKRSTVERDLPHLCVPLCGRLFLGLAGRDGSGDRGRGEPGLPGCPQARVAIALLDELVVGSDLD